MIIGGSKAMDPCDVSALARALAANRQLREEKAALMLRVSEAEAAVVRVREEFRGEEEGIR